MADPARRLYEALRALEYRAVTVRRGAGLPTSRREAAAVARRAPYRTALDSRRISSWCPADPATAQVPRVGDADKVWALVRVWSDWAGDRLPDQRYWMNLIDAAQPTRAARPPDPPQLWRQYLDPRVLGADAFPVTVAEVEDLTTLGVRARRSPYGYVRREVDSVLRSALASARSGDRRVVLLSGDSCAGKSRSVAEAVRADPVLRAWRLVVPLPDGGLSRLAVADGLTWKHTIVWLDNLHSYLVGGLDAGTLRQVLGSDPGVIVIATIRSAQLEPLQKGLADPMWEYLTGSAEVTRITLKAPLSDQEQRAAAAAIPDPALLAALRQGVGLGEWLVAGPELMTKLHDGQPLSRALADVVTDWYRAGLDQPLPVEDARRLWVESLDPVLRQRLLGREQADQFELFEQAAAWACEPVIGRALYEQCLVIRTAEGYVAHDYVVDQVTRSRQRRPVSDGIWEHALRTAVSCPDEDQRSARIWSVGTAGYHEHALAYAMAGMKILAAAGDPDALFNTGAIYVDQGDLNGALKTFDALAGSLRDESDPHLRDIMGKALVNLARLAIELNRPVRAVEIYDAVLARFDGATEPRLRDHFGGALASKAATLRGMGSVQDAIRIFDDVVARFSNDPDPVMQVHAARALLGKGVTLGVRGRGTDVLDEVVVRYGYADDPTLRAQAAEALWWKGSILRPSDGWVQALDEVITRFAGDPELREQVARALVDKAIGFALTGRDDDAATLIDEAVERFADALEPDVRAHAARAMNESGWILRRQGRAAQAAQAFDQIVDRFGRDPELKLREQVVAALCHKGLMYELLGQHDHADEAYQQVEERFTNAPELPLQRQLAEGLVSRGFALANVGRRGDAAEVYDTVDARYGDTAAPSLRILVVKALVGQSLLLETTGQFRQAVHVYEDLVSRYGDDTQFEIRVEVARGLVNKGVVLQRMDRRHGAVQAFDEVLDRVGEAPEPPLREQAARALAAKTIVLAELHSTEANRVCDQIIARFGDSSEPALQENVELARRATRRRA
jgi:tetratricopeptide (TPR) repeat protein